MVIAIVGGSCCSMGIEFQFFKMKSSTDVLHKEYIVNTTVYLKMVKMVNLYCFMLWSKEHKKNLSLLKTQFRICFYFILIWV